VFHRDKWHLVTKVSLKYFPSLLHRLLYHLTLGRMCRPLRLKFRISTVFLELNHGFGERDLWYETMIFDDGSDIPFESDYCWRYETKEEAEEGHRKIVKLFKEGRFKLESCRLVLEEEECCSEQS
jgi:hypothetical protein